MGHPIGKMNPKNKGQLHRDLGIAQKHAIPMSALMQAKHSNSPAVRKRANFAVNAKGWTH
jgi:hypothetical protein